MAVPADGGECAGRIALIIRSLAMEECILRIRIWHEKHDFTMAYFG